METKLLISYYYYVEHTCIGAFNKQLLWTLVSQARGLQPPDPIIVSMHSFYK